MDNLKSFCNSCKKCGKISSQKMFEWQFCGDSFYNNPYKILFVGKVFRGEENIIGQEQNMVETRLKHEHWPFWSYTKSIVEEKLGLDFNSIGITNLIKCDSNLAENKSSFDVTTDEIKENCLLKQKIFFKEINIIKPKHIIFYTPDYNYYLNKVFDEEYNANNRVDFKINNNRFHKCSQFNIKIGDDICHCLEFIHPQFKNKDNFIEVIYEYIVDKSDIKGNWMKKFDNIELI